MGKINNAYIKLKCRYLQWRNRRRLRYTDFSIISNNCWAGTAVYQPFGLKYNTPTVGLFIMDEDYILFLENLEWYLRQPLNFIHPEDSKYFNKISENNTKTVTYPIATLGETVEIHFLHYHDTQEASMKWQRRIKRINWKKLLIKMSIRDNGYDVDKMLARFTALPFANKICFAPSHFPNEEIIEVPELCNLNLVGGDETECTLRHIDIYKLLNSIK